MLAVVARLLVFEADQRGNPRSVTDVDGPVDLIGLEHAVAALVQAALHSRAAAGTVLSGRFVFGADQAVEAAAGGPVAHVLDRGNLIGLKLAVTVEVEAAMDGQASSFAVLALRLLDNVDQAVETAAGASVAHVLGARHLVGLKLAVAVLVESALHGEAAALAVLSSRFLDDLDQAVESAPRSAVANVLGARHLPELQLSIVVEVDTRMDGDTTFRAELPCFLEQGVHQGRVSPGAVADVLGAVYLALVE